MEMVLVYDGLAEAAKASGMTVEEFKAESRRKFENDPAEIRRKNADLIIDGFVGDWTCIRLNKSLKNFPELKSGRSCKIQSENRVMVTDRIKNQLFNKYKVATDF